MRIFEDITQERPALVASLGQHGWVLRQAAGGGIEALLEDMRTLGRLLGTRAVGRARTLEEIVRPQRPDEAHPRSLSARYGLESLPFHVELSHRSTPCRYLLLGCIDPGLPTVATRLLDWRTLDLSSKELDLLESAPVLVRSGRRSFYSTVLPTDRAFLRYDPCCLEAVDARGQRALKLLDERLALGTPQAHHWRHGHILIVDNWRVLHGRERSAPAAGRSLARILIDA